ncbi:hypothetical protein BHU61_09410 [Macrococcus epidermidis]|uniref:Lipoprotein n=1 Tax=Macrococcus epidermidis TaxID=1902580 RepID=A0A327ZPX1_9STAP|nr:hypothetical protein [Macrococcus epidermidis]RAK44361.1 hypothetical protein BHU61_09410 [Macrococcus epidermidis]
MGTKARWISSVIIVLTIVGLIVLWELNKPDKPDVWGYFGSTPESVKGKSFNSIDEAVEAFANAYAKEAMVNQYDKYYNVTDKFNKQHQIPGVITFKMAVDNEKNEILHAAPFYINEKDNKYSVIAEGISGSSERIKESPKYVFFTQPIDNHVYDFIISKEKKYLPKTDTTLDLKEHKLFIGIDRNDRYEEIEE